MAHSIASFFDFAWIIQNPATSSLSGNGPSVTVGAPRENVTRAPFELGWIPSAASSTPAFIISSLNRPIAATSSLLGSTPASVFLSARTNIMNRIVVSSFVPHLGGPSRTGLISTVLVRASGMRAAMAMASSRSLTSMIM